LSNVFNKALKWSSIFLCLSVLYVYVFSTLTTSGTYLTISTILPNPSTPIVWLTYLPINYTTLESDSSLTLGYLRYILLS